jgi:hypothetical protein
MKKYLSLLVILISIATVLTGLVQMINPSFILKIIAAEISQTTMHFFSIIGMFMALFGAMMLHAIYSSYKNEAAIFWAAIQKLGAAVAVGLGILHGVFNVLSGAVALFDLVSGIIFLYYYKHYLRQ